MATSRTRENTRRKHSEIRLYFPPNQCLLGFVSQVNATFVNFGIFATGTLLLQDQRTFYETSLEKRIICRTLIKTRDSQNCYITGTQWLREEPVTYTSPRSVFIFYQNSANTELTRLCSDINASFVSFGIFMTVTSHQIFVRRQAITWFSLFGVKSRKASEKSHEVILVWAYVLRDIKNVLNNYF